MKKAIVLFRRELRLEDNQALNSALESGLFIVPIFIFTPEQIEKNPYRSDVALGFMLESLLELSKAIKKQHGKLFIFYGRQHRVLKELLKSDADIVHLYANSDVTPYSIKRDSDIEKACDQHGVECSFYDDHLLFPKNSVLTKGHTPFKIFTPFYRRAKSILVPDATNNTRFRFTDKLAHDLKEITLNEAQGFCSQKRPASLVGGRSHGLKILKRLAQYEHYDENRDELGSDTTGLSPYLKFGCLSIREAYWGISDGLRQPEPLLRQLYWREFFYNLALAFPHVFGSSFHKKYDAILWSEDRASFERWSDAKTGVPVVDAAMRNLNETGFITNRARLIAASFLTKLLLIDWRWGEKYFANKLIDYDPAVNNGNWQWVAGSGADAQPYFRIFNPWLQAKKFDPEAQYIKRWLPELAHLSSKEIHRWHDQRHPQANYPSPMIDYPLAKEIAIEAYRMALR